ncbi:MAG TPA: MFS transporter [Micromonosporaceae bacterium]|nr:MFS transporter [Micromonosporaceae bacterium]
MRSLRLPEPVAFYLLASIVLFFLAGSAAPTPIYALYQAEWHFSPITTTAVFGVYALAVLTALLIFGSLSDYIGRRPVLLVAIAVQAATMLVFTAADGVPVLVVARVVQGLATGAALGAIGAAMLDLDKAKGTIANAVAPMTGTATGAIGAGLLVQFLPAPTRLVYLVLFGVFVVQAIGVALMAETSQPVPGAVASLRPEFAVPAAVRRPMTVAIPALVAVWALAGFYGSLSPAAIRIIVGSTSPVLGSTPFAVLAASAALAVFALRSAGPRFVVTFGLVALIVGVGITVVATDHRSVVAFFAGTVLAGIGMGSGFQGAIRTVIPLARPHERAGVLSVAFVVSYLALGVPAVVAGFLVVHDGGVLTTAREYGFAVIGLAALALVGTLRPRRAEPATPTAEPMSPAPDPRVSGHHEPRVRLSHPAVEPAGGGQR